MASTQGEVVQYRNDIGVDCTLVLTPGRVGGEECDVVIGEVAVDIRRSAIDCEFVGGPTTMLIRLPFSLV